MRVIALFGPHMRIYAYVKDSANNLRRLRDTTSRISKSTPTRPGRIYNVLCEHSNCICNRVTYIGVLLDVLLAVEARAPDEELVAQIHRG